MPSDAVTGAALLVSQASRRPLRSGAVRLYRVVWVSEFSRHDGQATAATSSTTTATKPRPSTATSTSIPGLGSAGRAAPRGMIGDASTLAATATSPPTMATAVT